MILLLYNFIYLTSLYEVLKQASLNLHNIDACSVSGKEGVVRGGVVLYGQYLLRTLFMEC